MKRRSFLAGVPLAAVATSCGRADPTPRVSPSATPLASRRVATGPAADPAALPDRITAIMGKPRYAKASWSLLVTDLETGVTHYELRPDTVVFTGSTRKLFSVGNALNTLGADHRELTPVHRTGHVDRCGRLCGDLVLVGGGDLTFGGRRLGRDGIQYTDFDHNDANALGTAILTPQDPLYGLHQLARQVRVAGIRSVSGDVVVDDRLFTPYRVPNGNLLITPVLVNENMVDLTVTTTKVGHPATIAYRPPVGAFTVKGHLRTVGAGAPTAVELSGDGRVECVGTHPCSGRVSGEIPVDYEAPFAVGRSLIRTFRIEDPASYARTAFIEALRAHGVHVHAPAIAPNPRHRLPARGSYHHRTRVAAFHSAPYREHARLVLKVSLNLGANLGLSLFGLARGRRSIEGALEAERSTLIHDFGVRGDQFSFPTNGSGTPDSRAAPRALVTFLRGMAKTRVAEPYRRALPVLGVDGSLAHTGTTLPGRGHVFAKPGTTVMPGADGKTLHLKAQNLAGYIHTRSGRTVAYALMVNDAGPVVDIAQDVGAVFEDEGRISSILYETL